MDTKKHEVERPEWLSKLLVTASKKPRRPEKTFMVLIIESTIGHALLKVMQKYGLRITIIEPNSKEFTTLMDRNGEIVVADPSDNQLWLPALTRN